MLGIIKGIFAERPDEIYEGVWADQYQDPEKRRYIAEAYRQRWQQPSTPRTDPASFDPLDPPPGWRYDPFYELWERL
jgi:hypothetical protein